jgi:hypothetical protein
VQRAELHNAPKRGQDVIETLFQIFVAFAFLVNLAAVGVLWWAARHLATDRLFWRLFATAWTANLLGNLAWIVIALTSTASLSLYSCIDGFYLARYLLIGVALWRYPVPWAPRRGIMPVVMMGGMALVLWVCCLEPAWAAAERSAISLITIAVYPILDTGLTFCAWTRARETVGQIWRTMRWISLSMTTYGAANLINFGTHMSMPKDDSPLSTVFWLLSDVMILIAVAIGRRQDCSSKIVSNQNRPEGDV